MDEQPWPGRILGPDPPLWAYPLQWALRVAEIPYAQAIRLRNTRYDRFVPQASISVPIISVGNITVGGTGKTPVVIDIARRLQTLGYRPAVVARGYKSVAGQPNDEERLIRNRLPDVIYVADSDRVRAVDHAVRERSANVIVLDDGFQHRRLSRSLDIVLIDATCPFGYGHLLPRGLLREPPAALRRADLIILTRTDQVSEGCLQRIEARIRRHTGEIELIRSRHVVTSVDDVQGQKQETPTGTVRAVLFAGIGAPEAFARTAGSMGFNVVGVRWWPDHHHYSVADLASLDTEQDLPAHDVLVTTEKDFVKLSELSYTFRSRLLVIKVAIDFGENGSRIIQTRLEETLGARMNGIRNG